MPIVNSDEEFQLMDTEHTSVEPFDLQFDLHFFLQTTTMIG